MKVKTKTEKETKNFAKKIAKSIKKDENRATIITLSGELGSGKTTFTKGFAKYFNISEITSPTFVIMKKYKLEKGDFKNLYHVDCYRLEDKSNLKEIKFDQILNDKNNIVLIEWPERLEEFPENSINLEFEVKSKERIIKVLNMTGLKKEGN